MINVGRGFKNPLRIEITIIYHSFISFAGLLFEPFVILRYCPLIFDLHFIHLKYGHNWVQGNLITTWWHYLLALYLIQPSFHILLYPLSNLAILIPNLSHFNLDYLLQPLTLIPLPSIYYFHFHSVETSKDYL